MMAHMVEIIKQRYVSLPESLVVVRNFLFYVFSYCEVGKPETEPLVFREHQLIRDQYRLNDVGRCPFQCSNASRNRPTKTNPKILPKGSQMIITDSISQTHKPHLI